METEGSIMKLQGNEWHHQGYLHPQISIDICKEKNNDTNI